MAKSRLSDWIREECEKKAKFVPEITTIEEALERGFRKAIQALEDCNLSNSFGPLYVMGFNDAVSILNNITNVDLDDLERAFEGEGK